MTLWSAVGPEMIFEKEFHCGFEEISISGCFLQSASLDTHKWVEAAIQKPKFILPTGADLQRNLSISNSINRTQNVL